MNNNAQKWLVGGGIGIIIALIIGNTFLNQAKNTPPNADQFATGGTSQVAQNSDQAKVAETLNNITRVEGQKIKSVNDKTIELENGEKIVFAEAKDINCIAGDVISDYDQQKQSLVCTRKDPNTGQTSTFFSSLAGSVAGGIAGTLIGNYIASKIFARNNGFQFNPNNRSFVTPNGTVFAPGADNRYYSQNSSVPNTNRNNSGRGGFFGGIFGGGSNNNPNYNSGASGSDSKSGSGDSGSKGGSHQGSGGVSTGSKGGSGGG
jgi:hypothetical protein